MGGTRTYHSKVREEQSESTRASIVEAAASLLSEARLPAVSLPEVAARAGVGVATVYRHFGTKEDLYEAVYNKWMEGARALLRTSGDLDLEQFLAILPELWRRQSDNPALADAMSSYSSAGRAVRRRRRARRRKVAVDLVAPVRVADGDRRRLEAIVLLLTSTSTHRHLTEYWDMSTEGAAQTAAWAVRTLVQAAETGSAGGS